MPTQVAVSPTIDRLWTRLMAVRRVVLDVSGAGTGDRRNAGTEGQSDAVAMGRAEGTVEWVNGRPDEITWREHGRWTDGPLTGTRFSSAYAWRRRVDGGVSISHTRFGVDRPVALVDLVETEPGSWRSAQPHRCAEDRYSAELAVEDRIVMVTWTVTGPTTDYVLSARYSPD
ncbi:MAG: DUF6314 family protein [Gemmatimonadales bacterium]